MKVIVINQPGGIETINVHEVPDLEPAPGMLTIEVAYAGVGFVDILLRRGDFGSLFPFPVTPGIEVSGYVCAIGEGVKGFYVGQPVAAMTMLDFGGYASMANVRPELTVPLDQLGADIDLAVAAASIVNLTTAYIAVKQVSNLQVGDNILIHGAVGGLGSFLGQVARRLGAECVLGTVGKVEKVKQALSLGYDEVFVRSNFVEGTLRATEQKGVHAVFDPIGGDMRKESWEVLRPLGKLVVVGNASGKEDILQSSNDIWVNNKTVTGFALGGYSQVAPKEVWKAAKEALQMAAKKEVDVEIFGVYPLEKVSEAHVHLEEGNTVGKLVLKMGT